jgi:hypothetical protein
VFSFVVCPFGFVVDNTPFWCYVCLFMLAFQGYWLRYELLSMGLMLGVMSIEITNQNIGTKQSENDHPCRDKSYRVQGWACTRSTCIFRNLNTLLMQLNIGLELVVLNLMFLLHARDDWRCDCGDTAIRRLVVC